MSVDEMDEDGPNKRTLLRRAEPRFEQTVVQERRGLLKGFVGATAGLLGTAGVSVGTDRPAWREEAVAAAREYGSENAIRKAIENTAMTSSTPWRMMDT